MEESDIRAPLYYVIGCDISQDDIEAAQLVLAVTPCSTAVVCRHSDKSLVEPFVFETLRADDEKACKELAAHLSMIINIPMLTVGEGKGLTAVYLDGTEEAICLSKRIDTN